MSITEEPYDDEGIGGVCGYCVCGFSFCSELLPLRAAGSAQPATPYWNHQYKLDNFYKEPRPPKNWHGGRSTLDFVEIPPLESFVEGRFSIRILPDRHKPVCGWSPGRIS